VATAKDKAGKAARNQALFRDINERIAEITAKDHIPKDELWDFLCECWNQDCMATISLSYDEYEAIRRIPTHFPVTPGHSDPDVERVVAETKRYAVVEKFGEAGITAIELDPRREDMEKTDPRY
jgi:hypothetical protein